MEHGNDPFRRYARGGPGGRGAQGPPVVHHFLHVRYLEAHDGELREISGEWEEQQGSLPTLDTEPNLFHGQFAHNLQDYWAWKGNKGKGRRRPVATEAKGKGRGPPVAMEANKVISTVLKTSASGDTYYARSATVVGMGERGVRSVVIYEDSGS